MSRVTNVNEAPVATGDYVVYWMIGARRTTHSFALDHAIARAVELQRPLIVLEPLRVGYRWASDRLHAFVLQGMADNAVAFARADVTYHPYVEPAEGHGAGLLVALVIGVVNAIVPPVFAHGGVVQVPTEPGIGHDVDVDWVLQNSARTLDTAAVAA